MTRNELRARAERILRSDPQEMPVMSTVDVKRVLHELQVHQIELEVQNEELRRAQLEAEQARDAAAELYTLAPVGYMTLDRNGTILEVNFAAAAMLGLDRGILPRRKFTSFLSRDAGARWLRLLQESLEGEGKKVTELTLNGHGVEPVTARLECRRRPFRLDQPDQIMMALIDVTERRRAADAVKRLNSELEQRVTERTELLAFLGEVSSRVNSAASLKEALAYILERMASEQGWDCGHAWLVAGDGQESPHPGYGWHEVSPPRFESLRDVLQTVNPRTDKGIVGCVLESGQVKWTYDMGSDLSARKGRVATALGVKTNLAFPILVGSRIVGAVELYAVRRLEVTKEIERTMASVGALLGRVLERHWANQELRSREEDMRAVLSAAVDAIFSFSREGQIYMFNPAAERMFGCPAEAARETPISEFISPHYLELYHENSAGESTSASFVLDINIRRRGDDKSFPIRLAISEISHAGRPMYIAIGHDLTRQRSLERAVALATEAQQRYLGQELHDNLSQQVAGLEMMADALAQRLEAEAPQAAGNARTLRETARDTQQTLHDLIKGVRPLSVGRDELTPALAEFCESASRRYQLPCKLVANAPVVPSEHRVASELFYIVQEAVNNAVQHAGASEITVYATQQPDNITVLIEDNGCGIEPSALFEPGTGLSIMRYRASQAGGFVTVARRPEGGTAVTLLVPV